MEAELETASNSSQNAGENKEKIAINVSSSPEIMHITSIQPLICGRFIPTLKTWSMGR